MTVKADNAVKAKAQAFDLTEATFGLGSRGRSEGGENR